MNRSKVAFEVWDPRTGKNCSCFETSVNDHEMYEDEVTDENKLSNSRLIYSGTDVQSFRMWDIPKDGSLFSLEWHFESARRVKIDGNTGCLELQLDGGITKLINLHKRKVLSFPDVSFDTIMYRSINDLHFSPDCKWVVGIFEKGKQCEEYKMDGY